MSTNSLSEQVWDLLHSAEALVKTQGFVSPHPGLPSPQKSSQTSHQAGEAQVPTLGYTDLVDLYRDQIAQGSSWPAGSGSASPLAILVTTGELGTAETDFVRSWFENPRVNYRLEDQFWIQPMPPLTGEKPPYQALFEALGNVFQPKAFFSLGATPAARILGAPLSLETLRNGDFRVARWPLLTTLDPADFLTLQEDNAQAIKEFKSQVWHDIQRLVGKLRYG